MTCSFMVESMAIANAILRQKAQDEESEVKLKECFCLSKALYITIELMFLGINMFLA